MGREDNLKPFKKGFDERRNLKGCPVGNKNRSTIVKKWLEVNSKEVNPITKELEDLTQEDIITLKQLEKAKDGDSNAYKLLMDSTYGLPQQQTDITTNGQSLKDDVTPIMFTQTKDSDKD